MRVSTTICSLFALLAVCGGCASVEEAPEVAAEKSSLRHVVLFEFQDSAPAEKVREIEAAFAALASELPLVDHFEWGTDESIEGLAKGFTHCFLLSFHNTADRDAYLVHPRHQEFVKLLRSQVAEVLVIDYWVR